MNARATVSELIEIAMRRKASLTQSDWDTLAQLDRFGMTLFQQLQREVEAEPGCADDPAFRVLCTQLQQIDADNATRATELKERTQEILAALNKGSQISAYAPLGDRNNASAAPSPRLFDSAA